MMLVLSRQRDESIMIGDDVEITIVDVRGDKVRLGITAPKHIPVHRREIYDAIQREKAQKAAGEPQDVSGNGQVEKADEPAPKKSDKQERTSQKQQQE
jgi:carbon storage regulator